MYYMLQFWVWPFGRSQAPYYHSDWSIEPPWSRDHVPMKETFILLLKASYSLFLGCTLNMNSSELSFKPYLKVKVTLCSSQTTSFQCDQCTEIRLLTLCFCFWWSPLKSNHNLCQGKPQEGIHTARGKQILKGKSLKWLMHAVTLLRTGS